MEETSSNLEKHIETQRAALRSNCDELEVRFRAATDWRGFYKRHTGAMVAAAFGGGMALAAMIPGSGRSAEPSMRDTVDRAGIRAGRARNDVGFAFDNVKSALIGIAATKVNDLIGGIVPGFAERMAQQQDKHSRR